MVPPQTLMDELIIILLYTFFNTFVAGFFDKIILVGERHNVVSDILG